MTDHMTKTPAELDRETGTLDVLIVVPSISRIGGGVSEVVRLVNSALNEQPGIKTEIWALSDAESGASLGLYGETPVRLFSPILTKRFGFAPHMILAMVKRRPQVVYVHGLWMFHCLAVYLWSLLCRGKFVVVPHGMLERWILRRSKRLKKVISNLYQTAFLRRASYVQALTEKEILDIQMAAPGAREMLIPNFVDLPPAQVGRPAWLSDGLHGKSIYLYFGRINEKKGCLELLRAWQSACDRSPDLHQNAVLVFAGWIDGADSLLTSLESSAADYPSIMYVGPQYGTDKHATISAATFLVLPSFSEGLPMVVLEAWAAGRPTMMTAACNLPSGFACGAAIEITNDHESLAAALQASFQLSAADRRDMGAAATDLVKRCYSRGAVGKQLVRMFKEIGERT